MPWQPVAMNTARVLYGAAPRRVIINTEEHSSGLDRNQCLEHLTQLEQHICPQCVSQHTVKAFPRISGFRSVLGHTCTQVLHQGHLPVAYGCMWPGRHEGICRTPQHNLT